MIRNLNNVFKADKMQMKSILVPFLLCPITFSRKINFSCLYIVFRNGGSAKCKNGRLLSVVALEI